MDKERLIITAIVLMVYLFSLFPIPAIVISVVAVVCYFTFRNGTTQNVIDKGRTRRRQEALSKAKIFITYQSYHSDIWRSLLLANDRCYLTLGADGFTIKGFEKTSNSMRSFRILRSEIFDMEEVWNMFCMSFRYNKSYDGLKEDCARFGLTIEEKFVGDSDKPSIKPEKKEEEVKQVDINNASETELTDLPGVSAIMAKKAIKRREEIGGFKNVQEFFDYLKIKPNLQEQLKDMICANEIKDWKKVERFNERNVDL